MVDETARLLDILHTGFIVCLVMTIMFFLISVLLFFVFDIRRVFLVRTGKAAKRDIKKLEEENFKTGRLANYNAGHHNFAASGSLGASQELPKTEQMSRTAEPSKTPELPQNTDVNNTTLLGQNDTTVLNGEMTTVLNAGATTVLNQDMQRTAVHRDRMFKLVKNEMYIHTEEII